MRTADVLMQLMNSLLNSFMNLLKQRQWRFMIMKKISEQIGDTYEQQGDYLMPCVAASSEEDKPIDICQSAYKRKINWNGPLRRITSAADLQKL